MTRVTAETITDEQIRRLHSLGEGRAITAAHALGISYPTHVDRKPTAERIRACREFYAAVLNDRLLDDRAVDCSTCGAIHVDVDCFGCAV